MGDVSVDEVFRLLLTGEDGGVVFMGEVGCGESDGLSVSEADTLEKGMSSQMLMTGGVDDEEVPETDYLLRRLACFLNFFAVLSISESIGNGVCVRKDLDINN